jgi:CheY-like chemotaxis protein
MLFDAVGSAYRRRKGVASVPAKGLDKRLIGLRLLVVDDSEVNREVALQIFEGEGARVALAEDGQQAFDWLMQHPTEVDVVLMDIQMPVLDGYGAMTLIRQQPALNHVPVVALTAGVLDSSRNAVYASGMVGHIGKPMDVQAAVSMILQITNPAAAIEPAPQRTTSAATSEYPGLAVEKSLEIWRGEARYRQYLTRFKAEYGMGVQILHSLPIAAVKAYAHKLNGAAGNMGLMDVSQAAGQLERVDEKGDELDAALGRLAQAIEVGLASVSRYLSTGPEPDAPMVASVDLPQAARLIRQTYKELDMLSPDTVEPLLAQLQALIAKERQAQLREVVLSVEGFDFRTARTALRRMASALKIELGDDNG